MSEIQSARGMPAWASATIIVVALAAGAGAVYWFFTSGPGGSERIVLDRGPEDGIKGPPGGRTWSVISGNTKMVVSKGPGDALQTKFGYLQSDFLTPEEFEVLNKGRRIAVDGAMAEALGLSPAQTDQLRDQVRRGFNVAIPEAQQKNLLDLFRAWRDAPGESRELPLLRALDEAGDKAAGSARQTATDAVARIRQIVSPQQWQKFDDMSK
jgi:hypothetical protein